MGNGTGIVLPFNIIPGINCDTAFPHQSHWLSVLKNNLSVLFRELTVFIYHKVKKTTPNGTGYVRTVPERHIHLFTMMTTDI